MHRRSQIFLLKSLLKYRFHSSPKTIPPFLSKPFKNLRKCTSYSTPCPQILQTQRPYSSGSVPDLDVNKEVDFINLKFAEAREEIEMALESKETVYFNEEAECARAAVKEVLDLFDGLLNKLSETQKGALQRSMGLKIEQLKAELKQLDD